MSKYPNEVGENWKPAGGNIRQGQPYVTHRNLTRRLTHLGNREATEEDYWYPTERGGSPSDNSLPILRSEAEYIQYNKEKEEVGFYHDTRTVRDSPVTFQQTVGASSTYSSQSRHQESGLSPASFQNALFGRFLPTSIKMQPNNSQICKIYVNRIVFFPSFLYQIIGDIYSQEAQKMKEIQEIKLEIAQIAYQKEAERKEILERKVNFLLGFITLIVGSFLVNADWLDKIQKVKDTNPHLSILLIVVLIILFLLLATAIGFILKAMATTKYRLNYPKQLTETLYGPSGSFANPRNSNALLNEYGTFLALAAEDNCILNKKKAKWLRRTWVTILLISFTFLVIVFILMVLCN